MNKLEILGARTRIRLAKIVASGVVDEGTWQKYVIRNECKSRVFSDSLRINCLQGLSVALRLLSASTRVPAPPIDWFCVVPKVHSNTTIEWWWITGPRMSLRCTTRRLYVFIWPWHSVQQTTHPARKHYYHPPTHTATADLMSERYVNCSFNNVII